MSRITPKHENKRIDSKKARAAENAALRGDHVKPVRGLDYGHRDDRQPPLLDEVIPRGKKQRKKLIKYCPGREILGEHNKRHYYIERKETVTDTLWNGDKWTRTHHWKECMYCCQTTPDFRPWFRWLGL